MLTVGDIRKAVDGLADDAAVTVWTCNGEDFLAEGVAIRTIAVQRDAAHQISIELQFVSEDAEDAEEAGTRGKSEREEEDGPGTYEIAVYYSDDEHALAKHLAGVWTDHADTRQAAISAALDVFADSAIDGWSVEVLTGPRALDADDESAEAKALWGFTARPDCDNCDGTGIFSVDDAGEPAEPCAFCLEVAIKRGELDGRVDGVDYMAGKPQFASPGRETPGGE